MKQDVKKRVLRRLKIIEGQVRGIQRMVEEEEYCIDTITQSSAIRHALSSFEDAMLEHHLETHVVEQMRSNRPRKAIAEILSVFRASQRK